MPRITGTSQGEGIQAVLLALRILEHLAQQRGAVGVTELAQAFGTTKSRIHRHLQTLIEGGYVIQEDSGERYRVSARLMALGEAVSANFDLAIASRPALDELRSALGHSVAISIPEMGGIRILSVIRGGSDVEIGVRPGSLLPFHTSSQGKVTLAFGDTGIRDRVLGGNLDRSTPETITDRDGLASEIDRVRARRWATSGNQTVLGLNALAAPVFDALDQFVGAVAIVDSVQFITEDPSADQIEGVLGAAQRISSSLGHQAVP